MSVFSQIYRIFAHIYFLWIYYKFFDLFLLLLFIVNYKCKSGLIYFFFVIPKIMANWYSKLVDKRLRYFVPRREFASSSCTKKNTENQKPKNWKKYEQSKKKKAKGILTVIS